MACTLVMEPLRVLAIRSSNWPTSAANVGGEVGILVTGVTPETRAQVRFQKPILGADVWECYADTAIGAGERVRIVAVEGSYIKVEQAR